MHPIATLLDGFEFATPITSGTLTMVPLRAKQVSPLRYRPLAEALADGSARLTEIGGAGTVPEVQLDNLGELPLLLVDGEQLVGAKQNRVLNLTVLAPGKRITRIPVSCVEQGRWHHTSAEFSTESKSMHFASLRARKMAGVNRSMRMDNTRRSDQGQVWDDVSACMSEFAVPSATAAMEDVVRHTTPATDQILNRLAPVEGQVGAAFFAGERFLGLDAFDQPQTFSAVFERLVRSYAIETLRLEQAPVTKPTNKKAKVRALLKTLGSGEWRDYPGVGVGTDLRFDGTKRVAGALVHDGCLVHLEAFPEAAQGLSRRFDHGGR
jgi:hypothetical protein